MKKPLNYYCHRQSHKPQQTHAQKLGLQLVQKIGEGSFGQVFKVFDPLTSQLMVIKTNKKQSGIKLSQEKKVLRQLGNSMGFQKLSKYTQQKEQKSQNYLIMPCLGSDFKSIISKFHKLNLYTTKRIGFQLLKNLKEIHKHGYVHRDLKPENILLGDQQNPHKIYLIDLGLATPFRKKASKPRKIYDGVVGTAKFCSIASHKGLQQFPKDDLESLGYVLLYLATGKVIWEGQSGQNEEQIFNKIFQLKQNCKIDKLCGGINCLRKYFLKIKALEFKDLINYSELEQIFKIETDDSNCYEFCSFPCRPWKSSKKQNNSILLQPKPQIIRGSIIQ